MESDQRDRVYRVIRVIDGGQQKPLCISVYTMAVMLCHSIQVSFLKCLWPSLPHYMLLSGFIPSDVWTNHVLPYLLPQRVRCCVLTGLAIHELNVRIAHCAKSVQAPVQRVIWQNLLGNQFCGSLLPPIFPHSNVCLRIGLPSTRYQWSHSDDVLYINERGRIETWIRYMRYPGSNDHTLDWTVMIRKG
jgi:hypothetical protein